MTTTTIAPGDVAGAAPSADDVVQRINTELHRVLQITDATQLAAEAHAFADLLDAAPGDLAAAQRAGQAALDVYKRRLLAVAIAASELSRHLSVEHDKHIDLRDDAFLTMLAPYLRVVRAWEKVNDPAEKLRAAAKISGAEYAKRTDHAREIKNRTIRQCDPQRAGDQLAAAIRRADRELRRGRITQAEHQKLLRQAHELHEADLTVVPYRPRDVRVKVGATGSMVNYVRGNAPHDQDLWPDVPDAEAVAIREWTATNGLFHAKERIDRGPRYTSFRALRAAPFNVPPVVIAESTGTSEARTSQIMNYTR